jgi:hypothetical protein
MKLNELMYAAVDDEGNIWSNGADDAISDHKEDVKFVIDTGRELKKAYKAGTVKIKKVRIVEVE